MTSTAGGKRPYDEQAGMGAMKAGNATAQLASGSSAKQADMILSTVIEDHD